MLDRGIIQQIERRFGKQIRYPFDCEDLTYKIQEETGKSISINTVKRLVGFISEKREPKLQTLDIIAQYIGFDNWDVYQAHVHSKKGSGSGYLHAINISKLDIDHEIKFGYSPDRTVTIRYCGDYLFDVIQSENSSLLVNDRIKVMQIVNGRTLYIDEIIRNDERLEEYAVGTIDGINFINTVGVNYRIKNENGVFFIYKELDPLIIRNIRIKTLNRLLAQNLTHALKIFGESTENLESIFAFHFMTLSLEAQNDKQELKELIINKIENQLDWTLNYRNQNLFKELGSKDIYENWLSSLSFHQLASVLLIANEFKSIQIPFVLSSFKSSLSFERLAIEIKKHLPFVGNEKLIKYFWSFSFYYKLDIV